MSLMTRAATALAVLSLAAIPVAALTIKNTSPDEVSVGVDNGLDESVYKVPAGGSVAVEEDCSTDCAVTGPWGYSRLVPQNATLETDGTPLVTVEAAPAAGRLVPQNPVSEPADTAMAPAKAAEPAAEAKPAPVAKRRRPVQRRKSAAKQTQKGPSAGSFQLLLQGPGKK